MEERDIDKSFAILEQELNSLYFLEVVYSTTMTYLRLGKKMSECRKHYKEVKKKYNKDDKYRNGYILKYRLVYWLFEHNLYILIKRIINGTGIRLPIIATGIAIQGESPAPVAVGIATLSSITGTIEIKRVIIILPRRLFHRKLNIITSV